MFLMSEVPQYWWGNPRGLGASHERGTPVLVARGMHQIRSCRGEKRETLSSPEVKLFHEAITVKLFHVEGVAPDTELSGGDERVGDVDVLHFNRLPATK